MDTAKLTSREGGVPLVSVLMPCFNHQAFVLLALDSLAKSTHQRLELLFIDDASSDNSYDLAREWLILNNNRFERIFYGKHEKNQGITKTLNELVSGVKGEYITILASDDMVTVNGISDQVNSAIQYDASYVLADAMLINEIGDLVAESALRFNGSNPRMMKGRYCLIIDILLNWEMPWTRIFIRSDLFQRIGSFDEELCFEDRDFIVRALIKGRFVFTPSKAYIYRVRLGNRLTPGLENIAMKIDFLQSEINNFRCASGLIRLLLGLNILAEKFRFGRQGIVCRSYIWPIFSIIRRIIFSLHIILMNLWGLSK